MPWGSDAVRVFMSRGPSRVHQEVVDLHEGYGELLALLDPAEAQRWATREVADQLGVPVAFFGDPIAGERFRLTSLRGNRTDVLRGLTIDRGEGVGGRALAEEQVVWVQDYLDNPDITHTYDGPVSVEGLRCVVASPVIRNGTFYGMLYAAARESSELGSRVSRGMTGVADAAANALHVAERAKAAADIAVNEERRRMSVELHDSVGALLFAIGAGARELTAQLQTLPDVAQQAAEISNRAAEAAVALRRSLKALHATDEELALAVRIREDCSAFTARTGVEARLLVLSDPPPLREAATHALVRAVREGLLNVEKHADAGSVVVTIAGRRDGVMVVVSDDGTGMASTDGSVLDVTDGTDGDGLGLEAAAVRVARVGGDLRLTDNEDGGVTLRVMVPC